MMVSEAEIQSFIVKEPILKKVISLNPVVWINPNKKSMNEMPVFTLNKRHIESASRLWEKFAPFLMKVFPETVATKGIIESPLRTLNMMKTILEQNGNKIKGKLMMKCDHELPVAGSIKARGGFFEILHYAEHLALKSGLLKKEDNYEVFASEKFKTFFNKYNIGVGSTGNLGLSIGIISAQLGFQVTVYVSADARAWKKDLLRSKGVRVIEFEGDFSEAILAGRQATLKDDWAYFVDDENSNQLYLGYSIGAMRLAEQLKEQHILVDKEHPLFVYSPCGVGGSPGGTAFGLKQFFGDAVHCFFVEPTHSPAVLIGLATGKMSTICVQDLGIDNKTEADGLAVGRPSHFATIMSAQIISGIYTVEDYKMYELLTELMDAENIFLEPSATPGLLGPQMIMTTNYAAKHHINMEDATHIIWATGGSLVPSFERKAFYEIGKKSLNQKGQINNGTIKS